MATGSHLLTIKMGVSPSSLHQRTKPLTRVKRTTDQRTKNIALMAKAVTVTFILISRPEGYEMHLEIERPKAEPSECWSRDTHPVGISVIALLLHMPRARGRPRRGAAWYASDSRRKRQKKFEKALAWHALGEPGSLGEPERLPWRMWRRLFQTNPSRFLQNISSSLSQIIGMSTPVS
jgi:hypothetical protein